MKSILLTGEWNKESDIDIELLSYAESVPDDDNDDTFDGELTGNDILRSNLKT